MSSLVTNSISRLSFGLPATTIGQWLNELSLVSHFQDFSKGIFDTKHLVFYLSFIFFGLFLTLFFLFMRFVPMIAIFEVRTLLPEAKVHVPHGHDGHGTGH